MLIDYYDLKNFNYDLTGYEIVFKKVGRKDVSYLNISCAFDIETTTIKKGEKDNESYGFMYHWQVSINGRVAMGRTWDSFLEFIEKLQIENNLGENKRLVIYVHNLAFEFQFMRSFIEFEEYFFKKERKPLKLYAKGIEFRCSYFLSNMSLAKFCENTPGVEHGKMEGDLDYSLIRTPSSQITDVELTYMLNDVLGLTECINYYLKNGYNIATIPLTSTGFVRLDFRQSMQTKICRSWFENTALNEETYTYLKKSYRGGYTHANRFYTGDILNNVHSVDISSSYPSRLMLNKYPVDKFIKIEKPTIDDIYMCLDNNLAFVGDFAFKNFKVKNEHPMPYLDVAHCEILNGIEEDNGRIIKGDFALSYFTDVDFKIFTNCYYFEAIYSSTLFYCKKAILPIEFRAQVLFYFNKKTELKGSEAHYYEYMKSKNKLNSAYGMCVTDPVNSSIIFENDEFKKDEVNIESALERFYSSRNNFLPYQVGVWCSAYARAELFNMINQFNFEDVIYCDTDSIKFLNYDNIKKVLIQEYNDSIIKKYESYDIKVKNSKNAYMGPFEYEGCYDSFCTLGAKKYAYNDDTGFHITVSGIPKKTGAEAIKSLENFRKVGVTYTNIGKNKIIYNDVDKHIINVNGEEIATGSNIAIVDGEYTMGISGKYFNLLKDLKSDILEEIFF